MNPDIARYIDHTLLRPDGTLNDVRNLCAEAREYRMAAVCVFPSYVSISRDILKGSGVRVATVVGFPFGVTFPAVKEVEMRMCADQGADEVDVVINIAELKSGNDGEVETEMARLTSMARSLRVTSKFIMETACLTPDEKVRVCRIANRLKPDFMKTSTGYGPGGATVEDVRLMRTNLLPEIQIKAAGGIRSYSQAVDMMEAGASRLGTSAGVQIVREACGL